MATRHPSYDAIKKHGPNIYWKNATAILRYWEHMENEHDATPEDYGMNVLGWHKKHHPKCTTLPSYEQASKP